jgi:hypothetical protein
VDSVDRDGRRTLERLLDREGALGDFTSHVPVTCATAPGHSWHFKPQAGNRCFLLVPINPTREGSYGLYGAGIERPASGAAYLRLAVKVPEMCPPAPYWPVMPWAVTVPSPSQ